MTRTSAEVSAGRGDITTQDVDAAVTTLRTSRPRRMPACHQPECG